MRKLRRPTGALWSNADFIKLWAGQSISELGSQVSQLAIPIVAASALHASPIVFSLLAVFGFLPFWMLGQPTTTLDLRQLTTIAYFGLTINWDGTIIQSGSGWTTWNSTALTAMVAAAHAHHVRVILSLNLHVFSGSANSTMCAALHPTHRKVTVAATVAGSGRPGSGRPGSGRVGSGAVTSSAAGSTCAASMSSPASRSSAAAASKISVETRHGARVTRAAPG